MKILFIVNKYPLSCNEVPGLVFHQQAKELKKQGLEVRIIYPVPWTPFPIKYIKEHWKIYSEIPKKTFYGGIEVYCPRYIEFPENLYFTSRAKRMYGGVKKILRELYKDFKFDLIHTHHAFPSGYIGMKIAQKYKKPLVITIHGADFYEYIFRSKKLLKYIKKVINFSNRTIVVSNDLKKVGKKELKINPNKFVVIPNGINPREIFKAKKPLFKNKKIILSVSSLIKRKAIDFNLKAISILKKSYPNIEYLIIGEGEEKRNLEKLVKDLNLQENVKFLGQLSHLKVMEYMSICDIFCLPSWNEAFGIVYAEAMANGKPVIGCEEEGCEDFIKNVETGILVKPRSVDSLVEAIDFLLSNPEKAKEMGERARRLVLGNYTLEKITQKLVETYNQIIITGYKNVIKN